MVHRKEVLTYEIEPTSETLSNKTDENLPGFFMEYKLKSSKRNWSSQINITPQPSVVPLVGTSKRAMRR